MDFFVGLIIFLIVGWLLFQWDNEKAAREKAAYKLWELEEKLEKEELKKKAAKKKIKKAEDRASKAKEAQDDPYKQECERLAKNAADREEGQRKFDARAVKVGTLDRAGIMEDEAQDEDYTRECERLAKNAADREEGQRKLEARAAAAGTSTPSEYEALLAKNAADRAKGQRELEARAAAYQKKKELVNAKKKNSE